MDNGACSIPRDHSRQALRRRSRRSSGSIWSSQGEMEKLGKAKRLAMAKRTISAFNGYFCQKLLTRRWCKLTRIRLSPLNVDILSRLHLPAPFLTVTLLTRGYFEVLFEKEEGAKAARKLTAVEWSG
ncbi:unnamed protein product [Sphagnum balticum]